MPNVKHLYLTHYVNQEEQVESVLKAEEQAEKKPAAVPRWWLTVGVVGCVIIGIIIFCRKK